MYDRNRDPQIDHAATDPQWLIEEMTAEQRARHTELIREIANARQLGRDPQRQLCELSDLDDERVDYNDQDHYDRKVGT